MKAGLDSEKLSSEAVQQRPGWLSRCPEAGRGLLRCPGWALGLDTNVCGRATGSGQLPEEGCLGRQVLSGTSQGSVLFRELTHYTGHEVLPGGGAWGASQHADRRLPPPPSAAEAALTLCSVTRGTFSPPGTHFLLWMPPKPLPLCSVE